MKIVINACYGGFSLSAKAVKRMAELQGKPCYFFTSSWQDKQDRYTPFEGEPSGMFWSAFSVPNPNEVLKTEKSWHEMTLEEREAHNKLYESIDLEERPDNRTNPLLVQVVEELGEEANGDCAELKVIEIPDGIGYEIDEYDGIETVHETHRAWS